MFIITLILMSDLVGGLKMGSRGAFLDKGFLVQKWKSVGYTSEGIKVLEPIEVVRYLKDLILQRPHM